MIADIGRVEVTAAAAQPVLVRNELPSPGAPDRTGSVELLQRLTEAAGGEDAAFLNGAIPVTGPGSERSASSRTSAPVNASDRVKTAVVRNTFFIVRPFCR